jgi:hypothetical protein
LFLSSFLVLFPLPAIHTLEGEMIVSSPPSENGRKEDFSVKY